MAPSWVTANSASSFAARSMAASMPAAHRSLPVAGLMACTVPDPSPAAIRPLGMTTSSKDAVTFDVCHFCLPSSAP